MEEGTVESMTEVVIMVVNMTVAMIGVAAMIRGKTEDIIVTAIMRNMVVTAIMIVTMMAESRTSV